MYSSQGVEGSRVDSSSIRMGLYSLEASRRSSLSKKTNFLKVFTDELAELSLHREERWNSHTVRCSNKPVQSGSLNQCRRL